MQNDLVSFAGELLQRRAPNIEVVRIYSVLHTNRSVLEEMAFRYVWERPFADLINNVARNPVVEPRYTPNPPLCMDDVKDIILGWSWRKMLPALREVQLTKNSKWYRHGPVSPWYNN